MHRLHTRFGWGHDCETVTGEAMIGRNERVRLSAGAHATDGSFACSFALLMNRVTRRRTSTDGGGDGVADVMSLNCMLLSTWNQRTARVGFGDIDQFCCLCGLIAISSALMTSARVFAGRVPASDDAQAPSSKFREFETV